MIVELKLLSPEGSALEGEEPNSILEVDDDPHLRLSQPIRCHLWARRVSKRLVVKGRLEMALEMECARCARFFWTTVQVSSFLRAYDLPEGTETVDVTPDIREEILLHLRPFPLCRPDCRGLCPRCGKDLNEGPCSCQPPPWEEGPWAGLDKLKL